MLPYSLLPIAFLSEAMLADHPSCSPLINPKSALLEHPLAYLITFSLSAVSKFPIAVFAAIPTFTFLKFHTTLVQYVGLYMHFAQLLADHNDSHLNSVIIKLWSAGTTWGISLRETTIQYTTTTRYTQVCLILYVTKYCLFLFVCYCLHFVIQSGEEDYPLLLCLLRYMYLTIMLYWLSASNIVYCGIKPFVQ